MMKRELSKHLVTFVILFAITSLLRGWLKIDYWAFWVGGILGTLLPDIDHLIYVYFLRPQDLTSQRTASMFTKHEVVGALDLLYATRSERRDLIFHSSLFQIIFLLLTFLVLSSSGSILGRGIVLAFSLHLVIDQYFDLKALGNIDNWTSKLGLTLTTEQQRYYIIGGLLIVAVFAIFF